MTQLVGLFKDSGGVPIVSGLLRICLDAPLVDISTSPDSTYLQEDAEFGITNGVIPTINLLASNVAQITYEFTLFVNDQQEEFYFADGTRYYGPTHLYTDGYYYTGYQHRTESVLLDRFVRLVPRQIDQFHAIVPNQVTVDYSELVPTRVATDKLPSTIRQLAELLTTNSQYQQALRGGPNPKGDFNPATYYTLDDWVAYDGSSYVYINPISTAGNYPPNATYWQVIANRGGTGTGTAGNDTAYDATGWDGQTDAPSRNAVRDIIEQLARTAQLANYAPISNPVFQGTPQVGVTVPYPDSSARLASTVWVSGNFAPLISPVFSGNPSSPTQSLSDYSNKHATTKWVADYVSAQAAQLGTQVLAQRTTSLTLTSGSYTTIPFDTKQVDPASLYNASTGTFTPAVTGYYKISVNLNLTAGTTFSAIDIAAMAAAVRVASLFYATYSSVTTVVIPASNVVYLTAGVAYTIAVNAAGTGALSVSVASTIVNRLLIERKY